MENEAPQKSTGTKSLLASVGTNDNVPLASENSSLALSEELDNLLFNTDKLFELEDVAAEYRALNTTFVRVMERFENIVAQEYVYASDFKYVSKFKFDYAKRRIRKSRNDNLVLNYDIFSNVLNSTLLETYEMSMLFFGSDDLTKWDNKLNEYRNYFINFGGIHAVQMIQLINTLYYNLQNLYKDFNVRDDSFQANFNFNATLELSEQYTDVEDRKAFLNLMILNCNKVCLSGQIENINKDEQEEFISKCEKAIEIINFEQKHFSSSVTSMVLKFKLATKKKTDFIKIISAMYDSRMFETEDGYISSNKQEIMNEFGRVVGEDLSNYSVLLSKSKGSEKDVFLKPFDTIRSKAEEYYNKELNK